MIKRILAVAFHLLLTASSAEAESLVLKIGEDVRLPIPANHRVWVQNRKLVEINTRGGFLILSGRSEGLTSLQVGARGYQVQVIQPLKKALHKNLEKHLRQMLGLRLQFKKSQVHISGKLYRWEDWLQLAKISEAEGVPYIMNAEIPPGLQTKAQNHWQKEFTAAGLAPLPIHFAHPLQARTALAPQLFIKYEEVLAPFGVTLEKDPQALDVAPVVKVQITVAEVRRDFSRKYGLEWPASYSARVLSDGQKEFEDLVLTAHALEKQGQGKILASPTLLCRSGKEAEFLAGGEFPIKISNYKARDIVWKKYGVLLKVKPQADSSGRMSIAIETEVSTIDDSRKVDGIPGLLTNRLSSHFDLSRSQTIVLSGLIKNEEGKSSDGLPGLSGIPVLGGLFGSRDFREHRTELVILVRPAIMNENSLGPSSENSPRHLGAYSHD